MKVGELRNRLEALDPSMDVLCSVDENIVREIKEGAILVVLNCEVVEAEKFRPENREQPPGLKYQKTEYSKPHFILEITPDF